MDDKKRILIVDDDPLITQMLVDAFVSANFSVTTARDGEEGLSKALTEHPDALIADVVMPKMDGLTMVKKVREDSWGSQAAIMVLTGVKDNEQLQEAKMEGIYYYLLKEDFKPEDVVAKVKERFELSD